MRGGGQRGGDPRESPAGETGPGEERKDGEDGEEPQVPDKRGRGARSSGAALEPDAFERRRADEGHQGKRAISQRPRQAEQQHRQQQGESENRRRSGQRHAHHDHHEQQERQRGGKGREKSRRGRILEPAWGAAGDGPRGQPPKAMDRGGEE